MRAALRSGRALDRPLARSLARELRWSRALAQAGRALRARDLSAQELDERLERRRVPRAARAAALDSLERSGLVDDNRFAVARAAALAARGYGDAAIGADLEQRGVEAEAVTGALGALDPERERAARAAAGRPPGAATARWLAARGFGEDAVEAVGGVVAADT